MKHLLLLVLLSLCACSPSVSKLAQSATNGAVSSVTSPESQVKIDKLLTSAVAAARDEALSPVTSDRLKQIVDLLLADIHKQIVALVRDAIDEATGPVSEAAIADLREQLVGAPLRKQVDDMIDQAGPHIATAIQLSLQPIKADADAEASKWKMVAIVSGCSGIVLIFALAMTVHVLRTHKKLVQRLMEKHEEERSEGISFVYK